MLTFWTGFFQVVLLLVSPFLYIACGENLVEFARLVRARVAGKAGDFRFSQDAPAGWLKPQLLLLGLMGYLALSFFLWHFLLPLPVASLLPFLALGLAPRRVKRIVGEFAVIPHLNFLLWFIVVFSVGLSLFRATSGVQTPWLNNYGDLAFHLGQIHSLVFQGNSLPEYHIFAGERLSYPFLVNFWSATLWWPRPSLITLLWVFMFQWTLCWCLLYCFLNGNRFWLLPWAVLLGGGMYSHLGKLESGELIAHNKPWVAFITTIWVTQRSALIGVCALAGILQIFHAAGERPTTRDLVRIGLFLALMPLIHAHFFLVGVLYIGGVSLFRCLSAGYPEMLTRERAGPLAGLAAGLVPAFVWAPWIFGKGGMVKLVSGWTTGETDPATSHIVPFVLKLFGKIPEGGERFLFSLDTWIGQSTATAWLVLMLVFWLFSRQHIHLLVLVLLWALGQFVQLAEWDWDQIKFFVAVYTVFISLWAWSGHRSRWLFGLHLLCIYLIVPATYEVYKVWGIGSAFRKASARANEHREFQYTVYTPEDLRLAEEIREIVPKNSIIVAAPNHNSPATLSGRRMFYGYEGTLSSHKLAYEKRRELMQDVTKLGQCRTSGLVAPELCPRYLLWTPAEVAYFHAGQPGPLFEPTKHQSLFHFKE